MSLFLGSKLADNKCTKNYFSLNRQFPLLKGKNKVFLNREDFIFFL